MKFQFLFFFLFAFILSHGKKMDEQESKRKTIVKIIKYLNFVLQKKKTHTQKLKNAHS